MITPVSPEDILKPILQSEEDYDTLQQVREHACNSTGQIAKTEDGEWVLFGADYEGKLSDLTVKAGGNVEIKTSYRTTGRARSFSEGFPLFDDRNDGHGQDCRTTFTCRTHNARNAARRS